MDVWVTAEFEYEGKLYKKGTKIDSKFLDVGTLFVGNRDSGSITKPIHALMRSIAFEIKRITGEKPLCELNSVKVWKCTPKH